MFVYVYCSTSSLATFASRRCTSLNRADVFNLMGFKDFSLQFIPPLQAGLMARRRLEARGGLLADIQTAILTEPLDSLFHITGELGR